MAVAGCVCITSCAADGLGSGVAIAAILAAGIAAWTWRPASARAGGGTTGADTTAADSTTAADTSGSSESSSSAASSDSTTTTVGTSGTSSGTTINLDGADADASDVETGPCLLVDSCLMTCACEIDDEDDDRARDVALGLLPIVAMRRRARREIIDRLDAEARLPADVLERLRRDD
jgi:hypothetical protein